jgi:histidinol-phosphate aminotransferase
MGILSSIANKAVLETQPYQAGKPIEEVEREFGIKEIIKLASNENALGASPKALLAAKESINAMHMYPDASYAKLREVIALYNDVETHNVTVGNGSENCMDFLIKAFLNEGSNAIVDQYCFATIQILIKAQNAKLIKTPSVNYRQNIDATIKAVNKKTKIIFVVNPNNPTGTYATHDELVKLLDNIPSNVLVISDEAYFEYVDKSDYPKTLELVKQYPNLAISRTFSKVFGLAGLRLGYLISSREVSDVLNRSRLPFNVNCAAVAAGIAALSDKEFLKKTKKVNDDGLNQLSEGFKKLNLEYIPSVANFITVNLKRSGVEVFNLLLAKGVIVRPLIPYGLPEHIRVTIGTYAQNEKFLSDLKEVLNA